MQLPLRHTLFPSLYRPFNQLIQGLFRNRIGDEHKIRIVIEEAGIVRNVLQIHLNAVRQFSPLHHIHSIQSLTGQQQHLKASVHIKILP